MTRDEVLTNPRFAGQVTRYHTWLMHHRQTVGEHTWQVMRIYWQIWGSLPPEVSTYLIWHDAGELVTGDLPFPVKLRNPVLKQECDRIEEASVYIMGGTPHAFLSAEDQQRVKMCDLIDMLEMGWTEFNMGNAYAQPILDDIHAQIIKRLLDFGVPERAKVEGYLARVK
jgi:5'-deoxynucleotidase YfbR-like HD superfamily hydrolase